MFLWNYNDSDNYKLDELSIKNDREVKSKKLAIIVQKEGGSGSEAVDTFPSGFALNTPLSGCIDKKV